MEWLTLRLSIDETEVSAPGDELEPVGRELDEEKDDELRYDGTLRSEAVDELTLRDESDSVGIEEVLSISDEGDWVGPDKELILRDSTDSKE